MPVWVAVLGGVAVSYFLIETELAIPAFVCVIVWTALLYISPTLAWWMLGLTVLLGLLLFLAAFWEYALGVVLGILLTFFIIIGIIHAL